MRTARASTAKQMNQIEVSHRMDQPHNVVWEAISDLESHVTWMKDAISLEFTTDRRSGIGTVMEVETRVGPLRTLDVIEVTGWEEGRQIDVDHRGFITGYGRLSVRSDEGHTLVTWEERLRFPWWIGGAVATWAAKPILGALWKGNLRRLEETLHLGAGSGPKG